MAMSLNGIIATSNNKEDFLSHENWNEFIKAVNRSGCLIWGRKTYEMMQTWDKSYLNSLKDITKIIVSSDSKLNLIEGFTQAHSPEEAINILKKKGFKEVILTGGSKNNSSFAKLRLINEIILNVEGVIIGKGIPLFDPSEFELKLKLIDIKKIVPNILQLYYEVE